MSRSEIKERLDAVYGDSSPSMATVKNWFNEFQRGRISVFDESRPDRRLNVREIADTVGISKDRVGYILHEVLGIRKLSARWEFLRRFVAVDETWIHWYTLETKEQSKQWTSPGECAPKKAKTVISADKVMATVFWDSQGVVLV
nr:uncharacterized protein LOC121503244 [Drosophila kikkawai]